MQYFMSEEEAIALIEENMDQIEVKMASGMAANESRTDGGIPGGSNSCGGTVDENWPGPGLVNCSCCICV
jgi:hypothetical protein